MGRRAWISSLWLEEMIKPLLASAARMAIYLEVSISKSSNNSAVWMAGTYGSFSAIPISGLNSYGIVDSANVFIIVNKWEAHGSLCNIAPMPRSDWIVEFQDLFVLAEHLFEEVPLVE